MARSRPLILNVNDDDATRYLLTHLLRHEGFEVIEAIDGREALTLGLAQHPDLIVLDVRLPDISGLEVCRRLKADPSMASSLVLQVSAVSFQSRDRTLGLEQGADAYLVLPIEPRELMATVRSLLRLQRAEQQLRELNAHLEQRVRDRTRALEVALERAGEFAARLQKSNAELQAFAYVASHDLQEPLRKIQAFGERLHLKYGELLDDVGRDYLDRMRGAAMRMQALIRELLAYSRISSFSTLFGPVDLGTAVRDVVQDLEASVEDCHAEIRLDPLPRLEADATQMRQLFQNLLVNALKFHRPGIAPRIRIYVTMPTPLDDATMPAPRNDAMMPSPLELPAAGVYHIHVEDNGIGFDVKYLDRIFGPFQRLHGRGDYEGTGMGLAICRKIVERHSGSITARSIPGQGSTFIITLPLRQETGAQP